MVKVKQKKKKKKKVEPCCFEEPFLSPRLFKIHQNERSSGSLCSAAARDPESVRARIGPAEAGNETRGESARKTKVEDPKSEANGSRQEELRYLELSSRRSRRIYIYT